MPRNVTDPWLYPTSGTYIQCRRRENSCATRQPLQFAFMPSSNKATVVHFTGDKVSDDITQNHLPPMCFVTTQHLNPIERGGKDVRYKFDKAHELGLFVFLDRVNMYICLFFCVEFFLFNLDINIYYIYYLKRHVFG